MKKCSLFTLAFCGVMLTFACTACNGQASGNSQTNSSGATSASSESTQTSTAASAVTDSSQQTSAASETLSDETKTKILNYLNQHHQESNIQLLDETNVGSGYFLIDYSISTWTNHFVLYNSQLDTYEDLPIQDAKLLKVVNENYFIFENKGDFTDSVFIDVPTIQHCFRISNDNGDQNFKVITKDETFALSTSVRTGATDNELLSNLVVTADGIEMIYKPSGENNALFYADATGVPMTVTSYNEDANQFILEINTNQIGKQLKLNKTYTTDENLYISSYQIVSKGDKTQILLDRKSVV